MRSITSFLKRIPPHKLKTMGITNEQLNKKNKSGGFLSGIANNQIKEIQKNLEQESIQEKTPIKYSPSTPRNLHLEGRSFPIDVSVGQYNDTVISGAEAKVLQLKEQYQIGNTSLIGKIDIPLDANGDIVEGITVLSKPETSTGILEIRDANKVFSDVDTDGTTEIEMAKDTAKHLRVTTAGVPAAVLAGQERVAEIIDSENEYSAKLLDSLPDILGAPGGGFLGTVFKIIGAVGIAGKLMQGSTAFTNFAKNLDKFKDKVLTATGLDDLYKWGKTKYQEAGQWFETKFGDIGDFLDEQFIDPLEKAAKGIAKSLGKELDDFVRAAGKELGSLGDAIGELFDDLFEDPQIKGLKIKRVGKGFQIEKLDDNGNPFVPPQFKVFDDITDIKKYVDIETLKKGLSEDGLNTLQGLASELGVNENDFATILELLPPDYDFTDAMNMENWFQDMSSTNAIYERALAGAGEDISETIILESLNSQQQNLQEAYEIFGSSPISAGSAIRGGALNAEIITNAAIRNAANTGGAFFNFVAFDAFNAQTTSLSGLIGREFERALPSLKFFISDTFRMNNEEIFGIYERFRRGDTSAITTLIGINENITGYIKDGELDWKAISASVGASLPTGTPEEIAELTLAAIEASDASSEAKEAAKKAVTEFIDLSDKLRPVNLAVLLADPDTVSPFDQTFELTKWLPFSYVSSVEELEAEFAQKIHERDDDKEIDSVVIHATDTFSNKNIGAEEIDAIQKKLDPTGYAQENRRVKIGYHYVIRRDGRLQRGRDISKPSETSLDNRGRDDSCLSIVMVGGINSPATEQQFQRSSASFTREQYNTLEHFLKSFYNHVPGGDVYGHNDLNTDEEDPYFDVQEYILSLFGKVNREFFTVPEAEPAPILDPARIREDDTIDPTGQVQGSFTPHYSVQNSTGTKVNPNELLDDIPAKLNAMCNALGFRLRVNSGKRYFGQIRNSPKGSIHNSGKAVDISQYKIVGTEMILMTEDEKVRLIQAGINQGFLGIGIYENGSHVHFDTVGNQGAKKSWGPKHTNSSLQAARFSYAVDVLVNNGWKMGFG
jgi:N-acetylmuramoyl-L-alanine amidase